MLPRHSAKHGKLQLHVEPTRAAINSCVLLSIPFRVNYWVIDALACKTGPLNTARFDETVVAYAAFEAARYKLQGTTVDEMKNRVTSTACGAQGDEFLISVTCDKTLPAARKCAGLVLEQLNFSKLFGRYSALCRSVNVLPERPAFDSAAREANQALQAGVTVVVTGRVGASPERVMATAQQLSRKIKNIPPKDKGTARRVRAESEIDILARYGTVRAAGLEGVLVRNYIAAGLKGIRTHLASGRVYFPKNRIRGVRALKRRKKEAKFAGRLLKLEHEALGALVYIAARSCHVPAVSLRIVGTMDEAGVVSAIDRAL